MTTDNKGGKISKRILIHYMNYPWRRQTHAVKGQLIYKWFLVSSNSSKKRTNEFFLLLWRLVFVCFLEEIEDTQKDFEIIWPLIIS